MHSLTVLDCTDICTHMEWTSNRYSSASRIPAEPNVKGSFWHCSSIKQQTAVEGGSFWQIWVGHQYTMDRQDIRSAEL